LIEKEEDMITELTLVESENRYRRLFESAQDGILILDAGTGAIMDVNPYLINMLGYAREEFVEKKLSQRDTGTV
jgi:PAS domain S-box-containing protein